MNIKCIFVFVATVITLNSGYAAVFTAGELCPYDVRGGDIDMRVYECGISKEEHNPYGIADCVPEEIDATSCWLADRYLCDFGQEDACDSCGTPDGITEIYSYSTSVEVKAEIRCTSVDYYKANVNRKNTYGCKSGYYGRNGYGTSTSSNLVCDECEQNGKSAWGANSKNGCYQPKGRKFTDASGMGEYTGDCYYTN